MAMVHHNTPSAYSAPAAQGSQASSAGASAGGNNANNNWRADAFLNAWIDLPGGKSIKLGAMTYKLSKKVEAQLIEMLSQPGAVDNLKQFVRFDFQLANQPAESTNMFAFLVNPAAKAPAKQAPEAEVAAPWEDQDNA